MRYLDPEKLSRFFLDALDAAGMNRETSGYMIEGMIQTSLRGVDSHGIQMFPYYRQAIVDGRFNKHPEMRYAQTSPSTGTLAADHASGHHAGSVAMQKCIGMAKENGIGAVSVSESTHFGAAAYFGLRAAEADCLGLATTMGTALVNPFAAKELFFGTNPLCFVAPLERESPLVIDMATSLSAWNRINNYAKEGKKIPPDWALDAEAKPTTDPNKVVSLVPIGGYKGTCVGMMLEILCSVLSGQVFSKDVCPMHIPPFTEKRFLSHFFMAIDISRFSPPDRFKAQLQTMVDRIRQLAPVDPQVPVQVPGDPEKKKYEFRTKNGIPIEDGFFAELQAISSSIEEAVIR